MKNIYGKYLDEELWLIKENDWNPSLQSMRESQFSLGNGYMGTRGILEELPLDCNPGTFVAGIYNKVMDRVSNIVNLPNPFSFHVAVNGEKISLDSMDIIKHQRILNLHKGILVRHNKFKNVANEHFEYQSIRFMSMDNKNLCVMQIMITPLDNDCITEIHTEIDTSVTNIGMLTESKKRHFYKKELGTKNDSRYLLIKTLDKKHSVLFWSGLYYEQKGKKSYAKDSVFELALKKNEPVIFTKICTINSFTDENFDSYKKSTHKTFHTAFHSDFNTLLNAHTKAFSKMWDVADIQIVGTSNLQHNLRFNIYHLLICGPDDNQDASIGARTLSGEGYKGHIFWDSEIFIMPFFLHTNPAIVKNMLLYRYNRLDEARKLAKESGFEGAKFPWESAGLGDEQTPDWTKDINGKVVKIFTHKMEHHITADIAYATYKYYVATEDEDFMNSYGYEIIFETARFWASRLKYNSKKQCYEINNIIGPDEFHINVNNNFFTNFIAQWNLTIANKLFKNLKNNAPKIFVSIKKRLSLTDKEAAQWRTKALAVKKPVINKKGIIEQFDGYFKLKKVTITETDENGIPILPSHIGSEEFAKTRLIKQVDVLMLQYFFPEMFDKKSIRANYDYYMAQTLHRSSLSTSICSIIGCLAGDIFRAYHLFNVSLRADISNLYGNTEEGIHAASLGGTYQIIIFGFAGISFKGDRLTINPKIPRTWNKLLFSFLWKGYLLRFEFMHDSVTITAESTKNKKLKITIFKTQQELVPNKRQTFSRKEKQVFGFYY